MTLRFATLILIAIVIIAGTFVLWGEFFESILGKNKLLDSGMPPEAAFIAVLLIWTDPILPIPVTMVLTTFGAAYGFWFGTILGLTGTLGSGLIAYGTCRLLPEKASDIIIGKKGVAEAKALLNKHGGWAIAYSRWIAIVSELLSGLAGLLRMPFQVYFRALLCGCIPLTASFVWLGSTDIMEDSPRVALILSAITPVVLWWSMPLLSKRQRQVRIGPE
jgi:uncharacterized membrane protein YdjX (TVP38/TMEM64 family)